MKYVIILAFLALQAVSGRKECECEVPLKLYEELQCKPFYEAKVGCCPSKYDCSHLQKRDKSKCWLLGKAYNQGEDVPSYDAPCKSCSCSYGGEYACHSYNCPQFYEQLNEGCLHKYVADQCCPVGEICPPFKEKACFVEGKYYNENENFLAANKTLKCKCHKGFNGNLEKPFCIRNLCLTELFDSQDIYKSCSPVYLSIRDETPECPYEFLCSIPKDSEAQVYINVMAKDDPKSENRCTFGTDYIMKGNTMKIIQNVGWNQIHTTDCNCRIPPFATCYRKITYKNET